MTCPICYYHEIAGLIQPKLPMFSTCNHWFQAPSPPVIAVIATDEDHEQDAHPALSNRNTGNQWIESDILWLRKEWIQVCVDLFMNQPNKLPPLREINHKIPLIDKLKVYHYWQPKCPDIFKPALMDKIDRYIKAGWWVPIFRVLGHYPINPSRLSSQCCTGATRYS